MSQPDLDTLYATVDATWPPAAFHRAGPWILREGRGGGKRVSAATSDGPLGPEDIATAEAAQERLGQRPLFMIRAGDAALDAALEARGYEVVDPVVIYLAPVADMIGEIPAVAAFTVWPPLAIQRHLWAQGGIGPGRLAVMDRAEGPKTALLARRSDHPAGCGFVALNGDIAMLHALEVPPEMRRQKSAVYMMRRAAIWAQDHGAKWFSLVVTEANEGARALYASFGMTIVGKYHYRMK
ncbi:GNAT family N-acetyltransferase [Acidimangrovimonas pyrenivorans]|uniref:GNAT family N-acetyltransferase n=1 Tax=Acidimangrovimonas pyrenivorans TaxID=2030798 RepID=A0ABV7ADM4_9RHOB